MVKSDNTFAVVENEVTSRLGGVSIDENVYADLYGKLSLKGAGLPAEFGPALKEMYRDLYVFNEGMSQ